MEVANYLKVIGCLDQLYAAIDTYDMATVVRAASRALPNAVTNPIPVHVSKSRAESTAARNIGNKHYKEGRNREAVNFYNKALSYAPHSSEEMTLAFGNRSAVFFSIRYFTACIGDIISCLAIGCSNDLAKKLIKRRDDAMSLAREEYEFDLLTNSHFFRSFFLLDCRRNANVPCASDDVEFVNKDNGVKLVTAGKDIKPGTVVAIERAFATCTDQNKYLMTCYYCNKSDLCLLPCPNCCLALFCTTKCQELCMKEYHSVECYVVNYLGSTYKQPEHMLVTRAAIKLSLKMGWDAMISASRDIGASRMRAATIKKAFNSNEPLSILSYDESKVFLEGRMFNGSLFCAAVLHCLERVPGYFPEGAKKREECVDAMSRVMLQLYVTFTNKINIICSAYDFNSTSRCFKGDVQTNYGWFSMSSKVKHSCEPNLSVVGLNDSVALVTLRTITRGEELTISYIGHFYDFTINRGVGNAYIRATRLFLETRHLCDCRVCAQNWDSKSVVTVKMTNKQAALFEKVNAKYNSMDYECFNNMCAALDAFPVNSLQHKCAYEAVKWMMISPQCKYNNNKTHT